MEASPFSVLEMLLLKNLRNITLKKVPFDTKQEYKSPTFRFPFPVCLLEAGGLGELITCFYPQKILKRPDILMWETGDLCGKGACGPQAVPTQPSVPITDPIPGDL